MLYPSIVFFLLNLYNDEHDLVLVGKRAVWGLVFITLISDLTVEMNSFISFNCGFSLNICLVGFDVLGLEPLLINAV